jgi:hypothetical protein
LDRPHDSVALTGSQIILACQTSLQSSTVNWSQRPIANSSRPMLAVNRIYIDGVIPPSKRGRYQILSDATLGQYYLVIEMVDFGDAGDFCIYYMVFTQTDCPSGSPLSVVKSVGMDCPTDSPPELTSHYSVVV